MVSPEFTNRWIMRSGGRSYAFGFWSALFATIISGTMSLALGQSLANPMAWATGLAMVWPKPQPMNAFIGVGLALVLVSLLCFGFGSQNRSGSAANHGVSMSCQMLNGLLALSCVRPEVLYPFTVAGPIVLMLIIGRFIYREHLSRTTLIACVLSITGLVVLTLGQQ